MKKLAKLTALLLTGVMLLLLASCGAAPNPGGGSGLTAKEKEAKQNILTALNEYRTSNGVNKVKEIPELSNAEQFWADTFRKAGDCKITTSEFYSVDPKYQGMRPSEWVPGCYFGWISESLMDYALETTDPSDIEALVQRFDTWSDFKNDKYTAVGIGVTTINGKIYWACTMYRPKK